jgi:molybdopterin molybdotransferase
MWFGVGARHTLVFALPGNPVSCYTCLHRYVLPALAGASGGAAPAPRSVRLGGAVTFLPKLANLLPVTLASDPTGVQIATPEATNTSGDFAGLIGTDGFVELPADVTEFPVGFVAPFWPWV